MASRIRLFDKTGRLIREPSAPVYREWVMNDIGTATFVLKAQNMERYIEFGNYITIEHDSLPTWVGMIVPPRTFSARTATVTAKSMMHLFTIRSGSYQQAVSGSWGAVFSLMIGMVNSAEITPLRIGAYDDGVPFSSVVDMSNLYTYLQRALVLAQTRLEFRPVVTKGSLVVYVDMMPSLYSESPLKLKEGINIKNNSPILIEQGDIYNDVTIVGIGFEEEKFTAHQEDRLSIEKYGRRQIVFFEGQSQVDVDRLAVVRLEQYAWPRSSMSLVAVNKGNAFSYARAGNKGEVQLRTAGYSNGNLGKTLAAYIKVVQFDEKTEEATLICQEV